MSRPILFRAWTGRTMMYQDQQYLGSFIRRVVVQVIIDREERLEHDHESYLPKGKTIDDYLLQYTNQDDCNGKKIYDGDLLEAEDYWGKEDYAEVAWNTEKLQWWLKRNGAFYEPLRTPFADGEMVFTIIGNRYENPELLAFFSNNN